MTKSKTPEDQYVTRTIKLANLPDGCTDTQRQEYLGEIKKLIMNYGAVYMSFFVDSTFPLQYFSCNYESEEAKKNLAYYHPHTTSTNHAVTLVG